MQPMEPKIYSPMLSISSSLPPKSVTTIVTNCNLIIYPIPSSLQWHTFNDVDNTKLNGKNGLRKMLREQAPITATLVIASEKGADTRIVRKVRAIAEEEVRAGGRKRRQDGTQQGTQQGGEEGTNGDKENSDKGNSDKEEEEEAVEDNLFAEKGFSEIQDFNRQQRWGGSCTYQDLGETGLRQDFGRRR